MKKKSIKTENGVAPASVVSEKKKKVMASTMDSSLSNEEAKEIGTEVKVSLKKKGKLEHGVSPASKAIKNKKKLNSLSAITKDLAPETKVKPEPVKNENNDTGEGEEKAHEKRDKMKMKKKSIKSENGVAPASVVIEKKKKVMASSMDSSLSNEEAKEIDTEVKVSLKKKNELAHQVSPASKAIKKRKKLNSSSAIAKDLAPETEVNPEPVETKPVKNENNDTGEGEEKTHEKRDKDSPLKGTTIFIANLPTTTTKPHLKVLFSKYGTIKTLRLRTSHGHKILFKRDLKKVSSLNGYVRFSSKEEMEKACEMNGKMVGENRIRVCPEDKKQIGNPKSTVFVGNIKRGTTDNDLYNFFNQVGPVEFVRFISTKNIAYVCFKKGVSMKNVLKLDQEKLNNRPLRVQLVDVQRTNVKLNKKGNTVRRQKLPSKPKQEGGADANRDKVNDNFHGKVAEAKKKQKNRSNSSGFGSAKYKKMVAKKLKVAMDKE